MSPHWPTEDAAAAINGAKTPFIAAGQHHRVKELYIEMAIE